jgi:hypothetical protein
MASAKTNKSGRSTIGSRRIGNPPRRKTAAKMRKSRIPDHVLKGNAAKHLSYREAWARIGAAQGHGFYLEAVTLVESMITDRLISYLVGIGVLARLNELDQYPPLGRLIQTWKTYCPSPIVTSHVTDLQTAIDTWRETRNKIVHSMVKSHPGEATDRVDDFLSAAKTAAAQGVILARALTDWIRKSRRAVERKKVSAGSSSCSDSAQSAPNPLLYKAKANSVLT